MHFENHAIVFSYVCVVRDRNVVKVNTSQCNLYVLFTGLHKLIFLVTCHMAYQMLVC